jgi:hypothetical protein
MNVDKDLVNRISAEMKRGLKEAQIKQILLSEKHQDYDIDKAIKYVKEGCEDGHCDKKEEHLDKIEKKELPSEEELKDWDKEVESGSQ